MCIFQNAALIYRTVNNSLTLTAKNFRFASEWSVKQFIYEGMSLLKFGKIINMVSFEGLIL